MPVPFCGLLYLEVGTEGDLVLAAVRLGNIFKILNDCVEVIPNIPQHIRWEGV